MLFQNNPFGDQLVFGTSRFDSIRYLKRCIAKNTFGGYQKKMASNTQIKVNSPNVKYTDDHITVDYDYSTANVGKTGDTIVVSVNHRNSIVYIFFFKQPI